jgi:hypothetical protein
MLICQCRCYQISPGDTLFWILFIATNEKYITRYLRQPKLLESVIL